MSGVTIDNLKDGGTPKLSYYIKNFGQTPAMNVRSLYSLKFAPYPRTSPKYNASPLKEIRTANLAPTDQLLSIASLDAPLTQQQADDLVSGKAALYFDAEVQYVDIFEKKRLTTIRRMVGGSLGFNGALLGSSTEGESFD